jgi:hypothetical protein
MGKTILLASTMLALLVASPALAVDASAGYSRRSAVLTYATRCELLTNAQLRAVQSGQLQARGAMLRAGYTTKELERKLEIAKSSVAGLACDDPEALQEIERVRSSHSQWKIKNDQSYPATFRSWETRRDMSLLKRRWRVKQNLSNQDQAPIHFGVSSYDAQPSLDLVIENQRPPRAVLLRMRDAQKLETPPSLFLRKLLKLPIQGVAGLTPPDTATQTYFATERLPAEESLLSEVKGTRGVRFSFGAEGLAAFSNLDPREAVAVDMYWSAGLGKPDRHQRLYVEVGDFMAARLFAEAIDQPES